MTERRRYPLPRQRAAEPERLAPSLLDRLIDLDPDLPADPQLTAAETAEGLRKALRRDLEMLLNTRCRPETPPPELEALSDSLATYGIEDFFAVSLITDGQRKSFARKLEQQIALFEPRLSDLSVALVTDPVPSRRSLRLRISARYRTRPGLPPLVFETRMDPVAGRLTVTDNTASEARRG